MSEEAAKNGRWEMTVGRRWEEADNRNWWKMEFYIEATADEIAASFDRVLDSICPPGSGEGDAHVCPFQWTGSLGPHELDEDGEL